MTDPITRARKEWCETPRYPDTRMANICPPDVVAALLDVLDETAKAADCMRGDLCNVVDAAEAVIARALEGK